MGHGRRETIVAIGDIHFPWHSRRTLAAIMKIIKEVKPTIVVQIGDLYDLFAFSRFPRTQNIYGPQQELKLARKDAEIFWATVKANAPRATCYQLWGNHELRAVKRALENAPELEHFVKHGVKSLMEFSGVDLVADDREVLMIDGVGYHHGYRTALGAHARSNLCSMVVGHTHRGGVIPVKLEHKTIWELNVGFCANRFAVPLSYGEQRRFSNWTLGVGIIDHLGPRFVPLETEERR